MAAESIELPSIGCANDSPSKDSRYDANVESTLGQSSLDTVVAGAPTGIKFDADTYEDHRRLPKRIHVDYTQGRYTRYGNNGKILVTWSRQGEYEADNPKTWTSRKKARVLGLICMASLCVTCASTIVASTYDGIQKDLGVSHEVAVLGLSVYIIGLALGPFIFPTLSEIYGRRPMINIAFLSFCLLGLPVAFANHIAVCLIFRFLTGFAGSAFLSVAGIILSDMWHINDSLIPMAFYTCMQLLGAVMGPIISGFVDSFSVTWRWCFWAITIWAFVACITLVLGVPEIYDGILLSQRAKWLRSFTGNPNYYAQHEQVLEGLRVPKQVASTATDIFRTVVADWILFLLCSWCAVLLAILYLFFELYPIVFAKHNFQSFELGLTFIGLEVGCLIALGTALFWSRRLQNLAVVHDGNALPAARLEMAKVGSLVAPIGLFIFGFTSYQQVHWIGPIIGSVLYGFAMVYVYTSIFLYTAVAWKEKAALAMSANFALRYCLAAIFPLVAAPMINRLGTTGTAALLAGLCCLFIPLPFVLARYGPRVGSSSAAGP